jgi:large subunit ribosomal protein L18e
MKSKTKIEKQTQKKKNPELVETLRAAKKTSSEFWIKIAGILSGPRRKKIELNLDEIDKFSKEGDSILVPGKVLSRGDISKKIAVIALGFSEKAREKILKAKSRTIYMGEEIKKNKTGRGLKVLTGRENENN